MKNLEIIGHIGKIEMRYTPNGKAITKFSVAVNTKKGEEKITDWFSCEAWEKSAEIINEFARVGSKIYISGSPRLDIWKDKETEETKGASIVVTVRGFEFLDKAKEKASQKTDEEIPFF